MLKNRLENMIKNARKAMVEYSKAFSSDEQMQINGILNNAEESLFTDDKTEIELILVKVEETASRITASMLSAV